MIIQKLIRKGYRPLTDADFDEIARASARGEWNVRKVFHTCEKDGYEAVDARGRVHGTNCCGSMGVLRYYKLQAQAAHKGPLPIKAEIE